MNLDHNAATANWDRDKFGDTQERIWGWRCPHCRTRTKEHKCPRCGHIKRTDSMVKSGE